MRKQVIWLYGLSGAGKTTLGKKLTERLKAQKINSILLDADVLRQGINRNLGFSRGDRLENIRRIAEIAKLFLNAGVIPVVAAITPYEASRCQIVDIVGRQDIRLIYVKCSLEKCEERDVKGFYRKAREGLINNFTGVDDIFEKPVYSLSVDTDKSIIEESFEKLLTLIYESP